MASYPMLNSTILPAPTSSTQQLLIDKSSVETINNRTAWDARSKKYQYVLTWDFITVDDYDDLETLVNNFEALTFIWNKYDITKSPGVSVLATLSNRIPVTAGTQITGFYSNVSLTLIEVNKR